MKTKIPIKASASVELRCAVCHNEIKVRDAALDDDGNTIVRLCFCEHCDKIAFDAGGKFGELKHA